MAQQVSSKFANAQKAPANLPVARVQLVLGNYFSAATYGTTATATSQLSPDYPPSGAIDGDRTTINEGAATDADNGIGRSTWRSTNNVSPNTPATLYITMGAIRTLNRVKIYNGENNHLFDYALAYSTNGIDFTQFAATPNFASGNDVIINRTQQIDVVDFKDTPMKVLALTAFNIAGQNNEAVVVEIEGYRVLDVTSRVRGIKVSRQRDYKLANPMAATVQLDCINTDRFFSISHIPTVAEITAGFVNQELRPNLPIIVSFGFNLYGSGAELVPSIVAYLDAITPMPKARTCRITARDGMKALINQVDSSNLKANIELSQAIRYVLNRGNVSNSEMNLAPTAITIPYFFTDQEDHLTTIRELTQAAGDSLFFINEAGIFTFQFYTGNLPLSFTYPTQQDWPSGVLAGNMEVNGSDQLQLNVQHTIPVTYANTQSHLVFVTTTDNFQINEFAQSFELPYDTIVSNFAFTIRYASNGDRTATFIVWNDNGGSPGSVAYSESVNIPGSSNVTVSQGISVSPNLSLVKGKYWYGLNTGALVNFSLEGGIVDRATVGQTAPMLPAPYSRTLGQNPNQGVWKQLVASSDNNNPVLIWGNYTFLEASGSGTWTSLVRDLGAGTTAFLPIAVVSVPNGNTIQYLTQSSQDGITFSGFTPVAANGQPLSPLGRYFQVQVSMAQNPLVGVSALLLDLTINWVGGAGSRKYPAAPSSFTFDYNSNLIDVAQELADNLGGDTSIINDVTVQASPILLTGADSDTVWQGTIGSPPVNISASTPLTVTAGDVIFIAPYISGGMDTSRMSGPNPLAAVITFGNGATGGLTFSTIHPTLPVLRMQINTSGTVTDLRVIGKTFSSSNVVQAATAKDAASVQQFGNRKQSIQNKWISSFSIAQVIANNIISVFSIPFSYIPSFVIQPTFSLQIGDRVTVHDVNLDMNADYLSVGIDEEFRVDGEKGSVATTGKLLAVPAGL